MNVIFNKLVFLFLLSLPFVSAFAITTALTLPLIIMLLAVMWAGVSKKLIFDRNMSLIFLFFLFLMLVSTTLNMEGFVSAKPANHILSFVFSFLFFTLTYSYLSTNSLRRFNLFSKTILFGVILSSLTAISEFVSVNVFSIPFDFIPRPAVNEYEPLSIGGVVRARGFAEESGHFSLYLLSMYMLIFSFVRNNFSRLQVIILTSTVVMAVLLSFSVSGMFFSIIAIAITLFVYSLKAPLKLVYILLAFFLLIVSIEFIIQYLTGFSIALDVIYAKLSGSTSMSDRSNKLSAIIEFSNSTDSIMHYLFGYGPAFYETYNLPTLVTLYPLLATQFGIVGLLVFMVLITYPLIISLLNGIAVDRYVFCSYFFSLLFFAGISNYWFPWFWIILAVMLAQFKSGCSINTQKQTLTSNR